MLVAIADARSFAEAAARLGYVQSTVSHAVAALEEAVGATLVRRRPGAGESPLTAAGAALAAHARRVLAELRRAESAVARSGVVEVAVETDVARFLLPELYRAAARERVAVEAAEIACAAARAVAEARCTLAIGEATDDPAVASRPLLRDRFVFVQPAASPARGEVTAPELARAPLVVNSARESRLLRALDLRGAVATPALRAGSDQAVVELVAAGLGCALVPELALRPHVHGVVARPLAAALAPPPRAVALAWSRADGLGKRECALADALAAARPATSGPCAAAA